MSIANEIHSSMVALFSPATPRENPGSGSALQQSVQTLFASGTPSASALTNALSDLAAGAALTREVIGLQRKYRGASEFRGALRWLRYRDNNEPEQENPPRYLYGLSGVAAASAIILSLQDARKDSIEAAIQIGFGLDPVNATIRRDLLGTWGLIHDVLTVGFELPVDLLPFADLERLTCLGGLRGALGAFGQASRGRTTEWKTGKISRINPDFGCDQAFPPLQVELLGAGFGATQPADVAVVFTAYNGGFVEARVRAGGWGDQRIVVELPTGVGEGPVGFIKRGSAQGATMAEAAGLLEGVAQACLGPGAVQAVGALGRLVQAEALIEIAATGTNWFRGGPPKIRHFRGNGSASQILLRPNSPLRLEWDVGNATTVSISKQGAAELPPINGLQPNSGSVAFPEVRTTRSWNGSYTLTATNSCGSVEARLDVEMKERRALVLAGGGAKGAFEVGAVRCLYDVFNFTPEIISGTSAGALNAVKLAEGPAALAELEAMWLSLQGPSDMFIPTTVVQRLLDNWGRSGLFGQQQFELADMLGVQVSPQTLLAADQELAIGMAKSIPGQMTGTGLLLIGSLLSTIGSPLLSGVQIVQDLKRLFTIERSLFLFDPVRRLLNANVDPNKVRRSGITLRVAVVNLENGQARFVNEAGHFVDDNALVDLLNAVQASASIPVVYPPVVLPGGNYIDGGVRENIAVAAADLAGASSIIAVLPSPVGMKEREYGAASLFPIFGRTIEAVLDENQVNDLYPYRGFNAPVTVIAPSEEVHSLFTIDPGLIRINMDYGYTRAYDEMQGNDSIREELRMLSDDIIKKRVEIWGVIEHLSEGKLMRSEGWALRQNSLVRIPHSDFLAAARRQKIVVRELCQRRLALTGDMRANPPQVERLWQQWEAHPWQPEIPSPWGESFGHYGPVLAAVTPPGLL